MCIRDRTSGQFVPRPGKEETILDKDVILTPVSYTHLDVYKRQAYLTFEHDEFTMKPTLDKNGRLIPREDYRISSLNCGGEDFAVACMRANLRLSLIHI